MAAAALRLALARYKVHSSKDKTKKGLEHVFCIIHHIVYLLEDILTFQIKLEALWSLYRECDRNTLIKGFSILVHSFPNSNTKKKIE